jgi:hypothetical protein
MGNVDLFGILTARRGSERWLLWVVSGHLAGGVRYRNGDLVIKEG